MSPREYVVYGSIHIARLALKAERLIEDIFGRIERQALEWGKTPGRTHYTSTWAC